MTILITGATGNVGSRLIAAIGDRWETIAAVRGAAQSPRQRSVGTIGPDTEWSAALAGCTTVVHLAAQLPAKDATPAAYDAVNHLGTARLVAGAEEAGVKRFIYLSSIAAVAGTTDGFVSDAAIRAPVNAYGNSKRMAEKVVEAFRGDAISLRPPLIMGSGVAGNWKALVKLAALPVPLPFAMATRKRSFMSVNNLLDAIIKLVEHPGSLGSGQGYVIADPDPISLAETVVLLRKSAGRRPGLIPVPLAMMELPARMLGKKGLTDSLFGELVVDGSRFNRDFGWTPLVTTRETIARASHS